MERNTTQLTEVCATTMSMLFALDEYDRFSKLCSRKNATDEFRVGLALRYLREFDLLPFNKTDARQEFIKSSKTSIEHRNAGNQHFMKNNKDALMFYCKSIAAAPYPITDQEDSTELALTFANRSAVYFVMKKYEACLRDIEHALMFDYPDKLRYKLLERRAKCYQNVGKKEEAQASAQDALQNLSRATYLPADKMQSTIDALNKLQVDMHISQCQPSGSADALKPLPQKSFGQHKKIPCASECVDIKHKPEGGRHVVANRDIDPGVVLFVEEPYASMLVPDMHYTHCNNCTKRSDAMIPCTHCDQVMYCSETCRKASWETCHQIECQVVPALRRLDVGDVSFLLALRLLLVACSQNNGIVGLLKTEQELKQQIGNEVKGFDKNGNYLSSDYYQVHHLFRNIRQEPVLQVRLAVTAACILNCLDQYSDFFPSGSNDSLMGIKDTRLATGGLILKFIEVIGTNSFSVTEFVRNAVRKDYKDVNIGVSVYSTVSLLNHSCDPTACKSFHNGSVNVIIAKQPIRKGEEVTLSYGDYYDDTDVAVRRKKMLDKYCFECRCIACTNNWPTFDGLESIDNPTFVCKTCRIPLPKKPLTPAHQRVTCKSCKEKYNVWSMYVETMLIRERVTYINVIDNIHYDDYISELARYVKIVDTMMLYPNQLSERCQYYLRQSMKASGSNVIEYST